MPSCLATLLHEMDTLFQNIVSNNVDQKQATKVEWCADHRSFDELPHLSNISLAFICFEQNPT